MINDEECKEARQNAISEPDCFVNGKWITGGCKECPIAKKPEKQ